MDAIIQSGQERLTAYVAEPPVAEARPPVLIVCHGYPSDALGSDAAARSHPELADRIANEGWRVIVFTFRGCGESTGNFSLGGWLDDLLAVVDQVPTFGPTRGVWLAGFGTGGGLCVSAAAARPDNVCGVATMGTPADFSDWASHPRRLLAHARQIGVITDPAYPPVLDRWTRQLKEIRPVDGAAEISDAPLLVLHGSEDETVPSIDARVLADAHGSADLRIVPGAAHDLRNDPRAIAILLGWLDRQRHSARSNGESGA